MVHKNKVQSVDTGSLRPWSLELLYELEPGLEGIVERAARWKRGGFYHRVGAYTRAKHDAEKLVGWFARDPRLRSSEAWDCFFRQILKILRL